MQKNNRKWVRAILFLSILPALIFISTRTYTTEIVVAEVPPQENPEPRPESVKTFDSEVSRLAEKYGQNEMLARKIIDCESRAYAHATGTEAVVGKDIGYFQINTYFHQESAENMGLDIHQWEDNLEYGFWLMSKQGTRPWYPSEHCWSK